MITLTTKAHERLDALIQEKSNGTTLALRIYVQPGGCSGYSYGMALDEPSDTDQVIDADGIQIVVDEDSSRFLQGIEVDFKETLMGGGFAITNPNAVRSCGCGSSFRTAEDAGAPEEDC